MMYRKECGFKDCERMTNGFFCHEYSSFRSRQIAWRRRNRKSFREIFESWVERFSNFFI